MKHFPGLTLPKSKQIKFLEKIDIFLDIDHHSYFKHIREKNYFRYSWTLRTCQLVSSSTFTFEKLAGVYGLYLPAHPSHLLHELYCLCLELSKTQQFLPG